MAYVWANNLEHLEDVLARVKAAQLTHYAWREPDQYAVRRFFRGQPFTALAVGLVEPEQRHLFRDLEKVSYGEGGGLLPQVESQLPRHSPVVLTIKASASKAEDAGGNPAGRASLPCS